MNTRNPTRAGARLGAGVLVSLLVVATIGASCAAPRAGASPPRIVLQTRPPASTDGPGLRIRIARSVETTRIDAGAGALLIRTPTSRDAIRQSGAVTVTGAASGFIIDSDDRNNDGSPALTLRGPIIFEATDGSTLRIDGAEHPGAIELRKADKPNVFDAIELVGIESYLPGVVAAEVYPGWTPTAFAAQAIAARSYALHERARRRAAGSHFDLENTTIDQAYAGARSSPKARQAVARTRGVVLMRQGEPLRAYYSSCCGGRPASARDTWPTEGEFAFNLAPPLQARERPFACGFSHHFNWSVTRTTSSLAKRLARAGADAGEPIRALRTLESIEAVQWNDAGRPSFYEVRDVSGSSWRVRADTLRRWSNASVKGLPDVPRKANVRSGDIDVVIVGETTQIAGRGFGHGVGMCQFGAEGFARRGWSRDRILRLYYPGARISEMY